MASTWLPLMEWLRISYPDDVPMPCRAGTKLPCFKHANGRWTWEDLEIFSKQRNHRRLEATHDIGILLHDICVVDVDDKDLATQLEARFPVLATAPCEETAKGRHYFFARSPTADRLGFFDGRAQVLRGVDFKTRCHTGTGGLILVAPSTGKSWLRTPWEQHGAGAQLPRIPDDLLCAVACPRHQIVSARLRFISDGSQLDVADSAWLPRFAYLAPFFEDDGVATDDADGLPVPIGTARLMQELLWLCETGRLQRWPCDLAGLRQLAHFLGLPAKAQTLVSTWHPASPCVQAEALHDLCPDWLPVGGNAVIEVDSSADCFFRRLPRDERWLFQERPPAPAGGLAEGQAVLRTHPGAFAESAVPPPVLAMLRAFPNNLLMAGSSALHVACEHVARPGDYDLFVFGADEQLADSIKQALLAQPGVVQHARTGAALTVVWGDRVLIQLILWLYTTPAHVLGSFDLAPCKVALAAHATSGSLRLLATPSWLACMRHMAFWVDYTAWSEAAVARILKYYAKGFDVAVPGLRRQALKVQNPATFPDQRGISNLLKVEAIVDDRLGKRQLPLRRPELSELLLCVWGHCGRSRLSAYGELMSARKMLHVVRSIVQAGMQWLGVRPRPLRKSSPAQRPEQQAAAAAAAWQRAPEQGCLFPSSPCLGLAFDFTKLGW